MKLLFGPCAAALLVLAASPTQAVPVYGGSDLLGAGDAALLEQWRGRGDITLLNIFDKQDGDRASDFHAAVDDQGETFTLIEVLGNSQGTFDESIVIGGYNPLSWDASRYTYSYTYSGPRNAFIFNLNDDTIRRQAQNSRGVLQTYNRPTYGPTFGGGHDIYIHNYLDYGYTYGYSYGNSYEYAGYAPQANILGAWGYGLAIGQIEVFAVNAILDLDVTEPVPEPGTSLLIGLGLAAFGLSRRKQR